MNEKNLLFVEGKDDEHVFYSLLKFHNVPEKFKVQNKGGLDNILELLDVVIDATDLERLGIVVDADTDLSARWQSLKDRLRNLGYRLPDTPDSEGTIIKKEGGPTVGVWLMPDNQLPGMLEDFVSFLGAASDPLWSIAENCLNEIPDPYRRFTDNHRIKAHIHTWLAWQDQPGLPLGLAITAHYRYLKADAPHAQNLIAWIRRLFGL